MVNSNVCNKSVATDEVCTLTVYMQQVYMRNPLVSNRRNHENAYYVNAPVCSFPLNTYNRHPTRGFLASGGSWYFNTVPVPSECFTVLVAAASSPELPKFGFALSSSASADFDRERESC